MATPETIEIVLVKLGGVFPGAKIGPDGIETYGEMLADIPDDVLKQSMRSCLMSCRFFPTIAEIREKSEPFLEKLRIEQIKRPDIEMCKQNSYANYPHVFCKLEISNPVCIFANTGLCKKWDAI